MPTVTSQNKSEFDKNELAKKKPQKLSAGEIADRAWGITAKNFPSAEGMNAHREAAKAYRKEKEHKYAENHESVAFSHMEALMKNK